MDPNNNLKGYYKIENKQYQGNRDDERFIPPEQRGHYDYQQRQFQQRNNHHGQQNYPSHRNRDDIDGQSQYINRNSPQDNQFNSPQDRVDRQQPRQQQGMGQQQQQQKVNKNYNQSHKQDKKKKKNHNYQNHNHSHYNEQDYNQQAQWQQKNTNNREESPNYMAQKNNFQNQSTYREKKSHDQQSNTLDDEMFVQNNSTRTASEISNKSSNIGIKQENQISFELHCQYTRNQLEDFYYLLKQIIGQENVQIVINNPDPQLITYLQKLNLSLELKGLPNPYPPNNQSNNQPYNPTNNPPNYQPNNPQYYQSNNPRNYPPNPSPYNQSYYPPNNQPTNRVKSKIIIQEQEQEQDQEDFIYQIEPQEINSVSAEIKMIILHKIFIPQCLKSAKEQQLLILINAVEYQYKIDQYSKNSNPEICRQAFIQFCNLFDSLQVVVYECQSIEEAKAIQYILELDQIKNKLKSTLSVQDLLIEGTQNLEDKDYQNAKDLLESVKNIKASQPMIFGIIKDNNKNKLKDYQLKFKSFIKDERCIIKIKEEQKIQMGELPDVEQLKQKLSKEKLDGFEILISDPNYNPKIKQYMIEVQYILWIPGFRKESEGQEQMNRIKEFVHSILNPTISFKIDDQKQIKLWKAFLIDRFISLDSVKVQSAKVNNSLQIILQGLEPSTREIEKKIKKELQTFKQELFECSNFGSKDSLQILAQKNISKLFTKTIKELIKPLPIEHSKFQIMKIKPDVESIQFQVIYDSTLIELEDIQKKIENGFVSKIRSMEIEIKFRDFLQEKGLGDSSFEDQYEVYVRSVKSKFLFISTLENLDQLSDQLNSFKKNQQAKLKTINIKEPNILLLNKIEEFQKNNKFQVHQDNKITFIKEQNQIEIIGPEKEAKKLEQEIIQIQNSLTQQLITTPLKLTEKEANYILKNHSDLIKQLQIQFNCQIQEKQEQFKYKSRSSQFTSQLQYQGKTMIIAYADIAKIDCDAIVNSCNKLMSFGDPSMSSGVAKRIQEVFGQSYINFCEDYINKFQQLDYGRVATYKVEGNSNKYIMNVSTPYYSKGEQVDKDSQIIILNISGVFQEAKKRNLQSLAMPIFGGGAGGYSFKQLVTKQFETIFQLLFEGSSTIQQLYITELDPEKIQIINETLKIMLQPTNQQWKMRYQWQWKDNTNYQNYDDDSINEQIDKAYVAFLQNPSQNQIKLVFPFTKQPGTHRVDFSQNTLTDISLNKVYKISIQTIQQRRRFCFDNKPIDDTLNEFLELQFQNKIQKFDIFYKRHKIVFTQNQIVQVNEETGYQRAVQCIPYNKKQEIQQNCLVNKDYQLDFYNNYLRNTSIKRNTNSLSIVSFDIQIAGTIQKQLLQTIDQHSTQVQIQIPNLKSKDLEDLSDIIRQFSIKDLHVIGGVGQMNVQVFKKKAEKFQKLISEQIQKISKYPKEWDLQTQNFLKVEIQSTSLEYQEIAGEFKKTGKGQIYAIYRIQNQKLYENYISEKKKLEEIANQRNLPQLTAQEKERYLWHGVRGSHPRVIYESLKEAFDITYSNQGMWGQGIYFAEQAEYSRNYSYVLQATDSQQHAGKLIFLCCKVCTGRLYESQPNNTLRLPPDGYDAVKGFTNGSNVYILYGMDVRRAYPAYEIIYK